MNFICREFLPGYVMTAVNQMSRAWLHTMLYKLRVKISLSFLGIRAVQNLQPEAKIYVPLFSPFVISMLFARLRYSRIKLFKEKRLLP